VSDGDEDFDRLTKEFFPDATHTIDVMRVVESLWEAAACLFPEGSNKLGLVVAAGEAEKYVGGGAAGVGFIDHLRGTRI